MFQKNGNLDTPFYERENAYRNCGIVSLAGCVSMVLAAFFYWQNLLVKTIEHTYTGVSFFNSVKAGIRSTASYDLEGNVIARTISFKAVLPLILFLLYIAAIGVMGYAGYKDNLAKDRTKPFLPKWKKRIRFGLMALTIVLVIMMTHTTYYNSLMDSIREIKASWDSYIEMCNINHLEGAHRMYCRLWIGPGIFFYVAGAGAYVFSVIYNFVLDTLNED